MSYSAHTGRYDGHRPSDPRKFWVMILIVFVSSVVIYGVAALMNAGINAQNKLEADWDAGNGHPAAIKLVHNSNADVTIDVPQELDSVDSDWDTCGRRSCKRTEIQHYPEVYPIGTLPLLENNCFVGKPENPVDHLMVTGTKGGGSYKLTYTADGKRITVCPTSVRQDKDKLVIWSSHPDAER